MVLLSQKNCLEQFFAQARRGRHMDVPDKKKRLLPLFNNLNIFNI